MLIALVIPPLVFRPDGRGLHDMAARSRTVRLVGPEGRSRLTGQRPRCWPRMPFMLVGTGPLGIGIADRVGRRAP